MNKSFLKTALVSTLVVGLSGQVQADVVDEVVKSFDVDENSSLRLENVNGSVSIIAWDKNEIKVTAIVTADDQDDRDRITIEMEQNSRGVSVETRYKKQSGWGSHHSGKVDYKVSVPFGAELPSIELVNGSLVIENVLGDIDAELVNGSIVATGLAGDSEISSVNGSIKVKYKTIESSLKRINLETVNGSVKLYLPDDVNASVEVETVHGSIKNDFGLKAEKGMFVGHNLHGDIGNGDISISIDSVNGSVKILKK